MAYTDDGGGVRTEATAAPTRAVPHGAASGKRARRGRGTGGRVDSDEAEAAVAVERWSTDEEGGTED